MRSHRNPVAEWGCLVSVLLVALVAVYFPGRHGRPTAQELQLVERVDRLGGRAYLPGGRLVYINLAGTEVTDSHLRLLREADHLRVLDLSHTRITGTGLTYLRASSQTMEYLHMDGSAVTAEGIEAISHTFPRLKMLTVCDTTLDDSAIEHLVTIDSLRTIHLRGTKVSDQGIQRLKRGQPSLGIGPMDD